MDAEARRKIGQLIGLNLSERNWTHTAVVIASRADLADAYAAVQERWRSLIAAISSGIAHMDYDDPHIDTAEKKYSACNAVALVVPGAAPPQGVRRVVFLAREDAAAIPDGVEVAYCLSPIDSTWEKILGDIPIVEVI